MSAVRNWIAIGTAIGFAAASLIAACWVGPLWGIGALAALAGYAIRMIEMDGEDARERVKLLEHNVERLEENLALVHRELERVELSKARTGP